MSILQSKIVKLSGKLSSVIAAAWLLAGLAGCVAVPLSGQQVNARVVVQPNVALYPPYPQYPHFFYWPFYSPWYDPFYPSYPRYPNHPIRPSSNLPPAQVVPVR